MNWQLGLKVILPFMVLGSSIVSAQVNNKEDLVQTIQGKPKCDENKIASKLSEMKADADVIFEMLASNCGLNTAYFKNAFQQHGDTFAEAEIHFLDRLAQYKPKVEVALANGKTADTVVGSFYDLSFSMGAMKAITEASCKGITGADGAGLKKVCALSPRVQSTFNDWSGPIYKADSDIRKKAAVNPAVDACEHGNRLPVCAEMDRKAMHGVTNPKSWLAYSALNYRLIQLVDGFAVFSEEGQPQNTMLLAVKQKSIVPEVHQGDRLVYVVPCLKFESQGQAKNLSGFPVDVIRFNAVDCPK